ncbi:MAG: hypothetical protein KatS3mg110_2277 [Pirellulaceae bacterium]|nr:MAG: hypothetical protein KatS3mg110_2277 [Pirellulaceae bacterium]
MGQGEAGWLTRARSDPPVAHLGDKSTCRPDPPATGYSFTYVSRNRAKAWKSLSGRM